MAHTINPSTRGTEAGGSLSSGASLVYREKSFLRGGGGGSSDKVERGLASQEQIAWTLSLCPVCMVNTVSGGG